MRNALLILGSVIPPLAASGYIWSIWRGTTRPHRMTRLLLVIITVVMTASLWASGDRSGFWLALASFVEAMIVWLLSFKHGMGGRDRLDIVCFVICIGGLVLWLLTDRPWLGLAASIIADFVAVLPALRKTIRLPHTEQALFYASGVIAGILITLAGPLTMQAMVFPLYIAGINAVFVVAIQWPRKQQVVSGVQKSV